jgi:hypothetical protein
LSIDPDVAETDQPYVFTNDDPLNSEDPLGLAGARPIETSILEYGKQIPGGTRGGNFPKEAEPNQILYRTNGKEITSYEMYGEDGKPVVRVDLTGESHGGVETPHITKMIERTNPETGETHLDWGPVEKAPDEYVPSKAFQAELTSGDNFGEIYDQITSNAGDGSYPTDPFDNYGAVEGDENFI